MLSPPQQAWVASAPPVRFAPESDYGPFVFTGADGQPQGLSVDMLRLAQQRTGLKLEWLAPQPLKDLLEGARRGRIDLLSSLRPTPERGEFLAFGQPYVSVPALVVVRAGDDRAATATAHILDAYHGRRVAVGAGYAVEGFVRRTHPDVQWQAVRDDGVALRGVLDGRYDAAVVDAASASFVSQRDRLVGLAVAGEVGFAYELSFAVRRGQDMLLSVIDAGLRAATPAERRAIVDRWLTPLPTVPAFGRAPLATRVALACLALAMLAALGLALQAQRKRKEQTP
ncbi:MAG TPA: transporter substrate-binding domain-containing protein [Burkholderiaceae bacterium]|nr:transporter substrate-binding domain-containing protein [Burkholderiaceae bacterium]